MGGHAVDAASSYLSAAALVEHVPMCLHGSAINESLVLESAEQELATGTSLSHEANPAALISALDELHEREVEAELELATCSSFATAFVAEAIQTAADELLAEELVEEFADARPASAQAVVAKHQQHPVLLGMRQAHDIVRPKYMRTLTAAWRQFGTSVETLGESEAQPTSADVKGAEARDVLFRSNGTEFVW